jgi:1-acyl-sn-glycerol-3-phosphate acyltransferase
VIVIRSILFNVLFYANLAALLVGGLPCLFFGRHAVQNLGRRWARNSIWLLDKICGAKLEYRGVENIPSGACIIASKHQSFLETFALTTQAEDFSFVVKRELMQIPFFGWYLKRADQIGIDRAKRAGALTQLMQPVSALLAEGRQFIIFPEGTRRPVGAPPQFKAGLARLYIATGAICVPVALNTGLFWPRRSFLRRPGRIVIEFLEPIYPGLDRESFKQLLQSRIETATDRLVAEACSEKPGLSARVQADRSVSTA